jgi:transposase
VTAAYAGMTPGVDVTAAYAGMTPGVDVTAACAGMTEGCVAGRISAVNSSACLFHDPLVCQCGDWRSQGRITCLRRCFCARRHFRTLCHSCSSPRHSCEGRNLNQVMDVLAYILP